MEISAQNTPPLLSLQWKQAASRLLQNKILADYCYFSTHKDTNRSDEVLKCCATFAPGWKGKGSQAGAHTKETIIYLFACLFICG